VNFAHLYDLVLSQSAEYLQFKLRKTAKIMKKGDIAQHHVDIQPIIATHQNICCFIVKIV